MQKIHVILTIAKKNLSKVYSVNDIYNSMDLTVIVPSGIDHFRAAGLIEETDFVLFEEGFVNGRQLCLDVIGELSFG